MPKDQQLHLVAANESHEIDMSKIEKNNSCSSNKQIEKVIMDNSVVVNDISYNKYINGNCTIYVSKPKIDKISVVSNIENEDDRKGISSLLTNCVKDDEFPDIRNVTKIGFRQSSLLQKYRINAHIGPPDCSDPVLLQVGPRKQGLKFLRLEWNPSNLNDEQWVAIEEAWKEVGLGWVSWDDILLPAKVTRVDVAVDIYNADISQAQVEYSKPAKTHAYYDPAGKLQTAYYGIGPSIKTTKRSGDTKLYDKRAHLIESDLSPVLGEVPHMRVEFTIRSSHGPLLKDLNQLKSPLERISLRYIDGEALSDLPAKWHWFFDACQRKGVGKVLQAMDTAERPEAEEVIKTYSRNIWHTEKLWSHWPDVVSNSTLLI